MHRSTTYVRMYNIQPHQIKIHISTPPPSQSVNRLGYGGEMLEFIFNTNSAILSDPSDLAILPRAYAQVYVWCISNGAHEKMVLHARGKAHSQSTEHSTLLWQKPHMIYAHRCVLYYMLHPYRLRERNVVYRRRSESLSSSLASSSCSFYTF